MRNYQLSILASLTLAALSPLQAQSLPDDLQAISPESVPASVCNFISMANWPIWPPCPANVFGDAPLYYSPSIGTWAVFADDRELQAARLLLSYDSGGDGGGYELDGVDYSTNFTDLLISLDSFTNAGDGMTYFFTIHNVTPGYPYEIISSTNVAAPMNPTNWYSEGIWLATSTNLPAYVPMGGKTNRNFFRAHLWTDFVYGVPTNGQIFIQSATNNIYPVVNGATNHLTPFWSNWFVLNPRPTNIYALNLGYDASDQGFTNSIVNTNPAQQVLRFAGFSKTITNLCISSNYITSLNIAGWPALQDVEAWHCISNLNVYVTNCPQLRRACFEAIQYITTIGITNRLDFTGCTNIAEIRAADNRFPDILITNGAGPQVWHFCVHDNSVSLPSNYDFTRFPSMRELWIWSNPFSGALTLTTASCTNLQSVQAESTQFSSVDVHGQTNLYEVLIYSNPALTNLNITGCTKLNLLKAADDNLSRSLVDSILTTLDQLGGSAGTLDLSGSDSPPSNVGLTAAGNLASRGWAVNLSSRSPVISPIQVTSTTNSAIITWTTDVPSDSTVYYGTNASYGSVAPGNSNTTHSVSLSGLLPNADYYFYATSTTGTNTSYSADQAFDTRPPPQPIYFVSTSSSVSMHAVLKGGGAATWVWADGVTNALDSHTFGTTGLRTNFVTFSPANALIEFGVSCGSGTALSSVGGLTNYPNLQDIFFFQSGLSNISLAGCSNLVHIALAVCNPTSATEDQWFHDLSDAQPNLAIGTSAYCDGFQNYFFYPASPGPTNSVTASNHLFSIGWHLYPY